MNKPLEFPFGFYANDNTPLDGKYFDRTTGRPYTTLSDATTKLPIGVRYEGLSININGIDYWWPANDSDLSKNPIIKTIPVSSLPDGLIYGGEIDISDFGSGDIIVGAAQWLLTIGGDQEVYQTITPTTFSDIELSSSGNQRYVAFFGDANGDVIKVEGTESPAAVMPTTPSNTVPIGHVLITDAIAEPPVVDLSGYAKLLGGNTFSGDQKIKNGVVKVVNTSETQETTLKQEGLEYFVKGDGENTNDSSIELLWPEYLEDGWGGRIRLPNPENYVEDGEVELATLQDLENKVDKVTGKGLSTEDYTTTEKNKLSGIATAATANSKATSAEQQTGTDDSKFLTALSNAGWWTWIKTQVVNITSTWSFTKGLFGTTTAKNSHVAIAASTSTLANEHIDWGAAYAGSEAGAEWKETTGFRKFLKRDGATDEYVFMGANPALAGTGYVIPILSPDGSFARGGLIEEGITLSTEVITALTTATYSADRATIAPSGDTFYQGQSYDDGTYTYFAYLDNQVRRW